MCDLIDTRIKELDVDSNKGSMNVQILENAKTEDVPSHPKKPLIVAAAIVLGLLVGSGFACMHDWMDQRIRSADEVSEIVGLPVLGMVPTMLETDAAARANSGRKVHLDSGSDIAESYRTLRTAIFFGMPEKKVKTILFTSPQPGDGKSTSVSNLAIAMAQAGQRTLLIDCDLRKPVQHKTYSASNDIGISNVVARGIPAEEAIQRTEVEGLSLLPCGAMPPNPAEILNSAAFAEVLHALEQKFDVILIDSPPVLPVTDARILGAIADMTILVLRAEKSTRKGAIHASDCLLNVGAKLFGAVVNDVPRKRGGYGYYAGYGYGGYGGYGDYAGGYGRGEVVVSPVANGNGHHAEKKALAFSNRVND
jgi:capsular exopolysaccharide synthesis family protein